MREVKFKAWDKNNKKIIDVYTIDFENGNINACDGDNYDDIVLGFDSTLIEYTGLKDKNGIEIYEGDILFDTTNGYVGAVVYDEACFNYNFENICERLWECHDELEVIGNIYENPDLLESETNE